jgi:ketosteroid isomerase-like protein
MPVRLGVPGRPIRTKRGEIDMPNDADIVQRGWEAVARGDWDTLVADYTDDMIFVMPGQNDVLEGTAAFRTALENIGAALPPGFDITALRHVGNSGDVVSLVEWKSDKVPDGSQLAVLFRLRGGKVFEERWFVDTEQWKAAF